MIGIVKLVLVASLSLVGVSHASMAPSAFIASRQYKGSRNSLSSQKHELTSSRNGVLRKVGDRPQTKLNAIMDIVGVSPEPIHTAFSIATFGPQPFWLFLILLPKAEITKKLMGKMGTYYLLLVC